jgi:hypothetical protein
VRAADAGPDLPFVRNIIPIYLFQSPVLVHMGALVFAFTNHGSDLGRASARRPGGERDDAADRAGRVDLR